MFFLNVNYPQAITELDPSYSLTYQLKFYLKQNDCLYIDIYVKYKMHYSQLYQSTCSWICVAPSYCVVAVHWLNSSRSMIHLEIIQSKHFFWIGPCTSFFPVIYCFHFLPCLMLTRAIKGHTVVQYMSCSQSSRFFLFFFF